MSLAAATSATILIVEDDLIVSDFLAVLIRGDLEIPTHILVATTLQDALTILAAQEIDIMLIDPGLPDSQGLHTIRTLMEAAPLVATAIITARPEREDKYEAYEHGAKGYYDKITLLQHWQEIQLIQSLLTDVRGMKDVDGNPDSSAD